MNAVLTGLLGVLIGGFIGHRFALGRDKRKEHNDVVLPIKQKLLDHLDYLSECSTQSYISETDLKALRGILKERHYKKIKLAFDCYSQLIQQYMRVDDLGQIYYENDDCKIILNKAKEMNRLIKLK
ncbi:hypothetical protein [Photobacterium leiognathi]|uniref:hypothetical protein n=1 Tax=Photobacterium leiognathi TaxID=553611 RepID=UPI000D161F36|nr:hypothetical protein [Photobacterium leiognathi]PSW53488.1 hypothetical protein C0W50_19450 [Photobacterium leiognathi subsp. mandapamensis]